MEYSLGQNIKSLRKKNQLSQVKLAELMNVSPQAISKWENGKSIPDIVNINALAAIFNTSIEKLIEPDNVELDEKKEIGSDIEEQNQCEYIVEKKNNLSLSKNYTLDNMDEGADKAIFSQRWINVLGFILNITLYLLLYHFFSFEHPTIDYIIIIALYIGAPTTYYIGFQLINKKYVKPYFSLILLANLALFLVTLIYHFTKIVLTIG